jgi:predicted nucleotidyltransferase
MDWVAGIRGIRTHRRRCPCYPNSYPQGAPYEYYTRDEAERAIAHTTHILAFCERLLAEPGTGADAPETGSAPSAKRYPEIEEIWLFGSLARGDAVPGSDADLLIVLRPSPLSFLARSAHYQPDFCGVGVDTLAYTRAELVTMQSENNPFLCQVQSEWLLLYPAEQTNNERTTIAKET